MIAGAAGELQIFRGYDAEDLTLFAEFANLHARGEPGFVTDFMGCRVRASSLWEGARHLDGQVASAPVPADFHSEAVEWIGVLKSARDARDAYVALEVGAGLAQWCVAGGTAARMRGITTVRLYAAEADPDRFRLMTQNFVDNGFSPECHCLLNTAVGTASGSVVWPIHSDATEDWGATAIAQAGASDYRGLVRERAATVPLVPLASLLQREPRWSLVHIDIQGDEVAVCRSAIDDLSARVRWLVVGTHSRKIDGDLLELMTQHGWHLVNEKPTRFVFRSDAPSIRAMTSVDGTQVWRNPRLDRGHDRVVPSSSSKVAEHSARDAELASHDPEIPGCSPVVDLRQGSAAIDASATSLAQSTRELEALRTQVQGLERALQAGNAVLAAVYSSSSWRITAPLRRAGGALRFIGGGAKAWITLRPGSRPHRVARKLLSTLETSRSSAFGHSPQHEKPNREEEENLAPAAAPEPTPCALSERERYVYARLAKAATKQAS